MNAHLVTETQHVLRETLLVVEAETKAVEFANVAEFNSLQHVKRDALAKLKNTLAQLQNGGMKIDNESVRLLQKKLQEALEKNQVALFAAETSIKRITDRYINGIRSALGQETRVYSEKGIKDVSTNAAPLSINLNETI